MSDIRLRGWLVVIIGLCASVLCIILATAGSVRADAAYAAQADASRSAQKIGIFEDVTIGPTETWENVVVVGGDLTVYGTVRDKLVVVAGDAFIASGARVGLDEDPDDRAVWVFFGDVTVEAQAEVPGGVFRGLPVPDWVSAVTLSPDYDSWSWGSLAGYIWTLVFLVIIAVVATAVVPRQTVAVADRVRGHFFSSLGWGALLVIVVVPLISVVLIVTLIGILLLIPWLGVVVPAVGLFGFVAVGAMVGRLILGRKSGERGPLMLAAVVGVILLSILWWIPIAGGIALFLIGLVGFGATCVALWDWRRRAGRERRAARAAASQPGAYSESWDPRLPPGGGSPPPGGGSPPPA